jgi:predicted  nucleic acid-binding Zn-ribbon protein
MTKALEDELNLPRLEDALKEAAESQSQEVPAVNAEVSKMADVLANASPLAISAASDPAGVKEHTTEADEIYDVAMRAHKDLMDLGFNIEPKNAGPNAFTPALKALEIALKASRSKSERRMEEIRLIMEQDKHKRDMNEGIEDGEFVDNGTSITVNRNDLMAKIRNGEI